MSAKPAIPNHNGKSQTLRVLMVEDSESDMLLLLRALQRGGFQTLHERVATARELRAALEKNAWDLILADHAMPNFSAPEALSMVKRAGLDIPFIIVSGHIEEEMAVSAMQAGAHDYIMKDRLARLVPAVSRELREAEVRRARRKSEEELRSAREELEIRVESRTADLQAANLKLQNVIEERKRLENELLEIAENERRRIGFDLHDDLGQKLAGVSLMAKGIEHRLTAEQHPCAPDAQRLQSLVEEIVDHTHNLARQFASLDIHGDKLPSVLKELAANVQRMFPISCAFSIKGRVPTLPQNTTIQLYKICQEAVSNSIKHGKATQVSITLALSNDALNLTIKNDGRPFSRPPPGSRMGLRIMNYRASTIGATLNIEPLKKKGTVVTCVLPLADNGRPARRHQTKTSKSASCHLHHLIPAGSPT
jgi:signal transduction histidine kinase